MQRQQDCGRNFHIAFWKLELSGNVIAPRDRECNSRINVFTACSATSPGYPHSPGSAQETQWVSKTSQCGSICNVNTGHSKKKSRDHKVSSKSPRGPASSPGSPFSILRTPVPAVLQMHQRVRKQERRTHPHPSVQSCVLASTSR